MLLMLIAVMMGPGSFHGQNKKGTYYYPKYRSNSSYRTYLPLAAVPEKFGFNTLLSKDALPAAFSRRNSLRAQLLYQQKTLNLQSVVDIFHLDPESGDGRFLLQFYLFLSGRHYNIPADSNPTPDTRTSMLDFFTSLRQGDIAGMASRLSSLGLSANHQLRLTIFLARKLLESGFSKKAYTLFRQALRTLEVSNYGLRLSWAEKHDYYRFLVLTLASITHLRGEYRKAFGILHWVTRSTSGTSVERVNCTMEQIILGKCKPTAPQKGKHRELLKLSAERQAYHRTLLTWATGWNRGTACFNKFLSDFPRTRNRRKIENFLIWINSNPQ
ncbi:hypothetical protein KKF84_14185 [Myxococcota bacterium]|nr:hypothetical protein [Myxococcota bacterium]MBU1536472.1 hypothetical protein [Myxococcota bacterium]